MSEGPTGQGKGTLLATPWFSTFASKAFLSSIPPTPPADGGFLQTSGEALVWKADDLHGLTPAQGRALLLEVPGAGVRGTASPQGKDRARRQQSLAPATLPSLQCPRTMPRCGMVPEALHMSHVLLVTSKFNASVLQWL